MTAIRIVIANSSLVSYPEAGGHWMWLIQHLLGLRDLGHDVLWLELFRSSGSPDRDSILIAHFFKHFADFGLSDFTCVASFPKGVPCDLDSASYFGKTRLEFEQYAASADLLWNIAASLRQPLLSLFRRRVLIDVDPGHLQVSAVDWDLGIHDHDMFFSVGSKMSDVDCEVPQLGVHWHTFLPVTYLPLWKIKPVVGFDAPFTSITQWNWDELEFEGRRLSIGKRMAYMRYVGLPQLCQRPFELAANIHSQDATGDRESLQQHGWKLADPHMVASSPALYQSYIYRARAEFSCPKPIFRELHTGWLSDRSASFLAAGKPVLAEDTGISDHFATNRGLVTFETLEEAAERVAEIDGNYERHSRAAREFAEEHLNSRRCLAQMLELCG